MRRPRRGYRHKPAGSLPLFAFAGGRMHGLLDAADTGALSCYRIVLPPGGEIRPAYHKKAVELIWVLQGGGRAGLERRSVRLRRGDALVIHPPTPHGFTAGRRGMTFLAALSPRVDSRTDYHPCDGPHAAPKVLSGRWTESRPPRRPA